MGEAADLLKEFGVECSLQIFSAHRTPQEALDFATTAEENGYQIIIAGAGMAAHLPGVLASRTTLPVIGVPISGQVLEGVDAVWSILQMPPGIPVATMAINGAKNAALMAVEILALADGELKRRLIAYRERMRNESLEKNRLLQEKGYTTK